MLHVLFGNGSLEKILLFLFVNESAYGCQIQILLKLPLTPIQNGLNRLEKGKVIKSEKQGKMKIYRMDPLYPFYQELNSLLKRAYTLLSPNEKRQYCFTHKPKLSYQNEIKKNRDRHREILAFWKRLQKIKTISFTAKLRHHERESIKTGHGEANATLQNENLIILQERGVWFDEEKPEHTFHNTLRWSLDINSGLIALEHLRYGESKPVFLFHLAPQGQGVLESVDAHLCSDDTYLGTIIWNEESIDFRWRVIGSRKNDELQYRYF